MYTKFMLVPNEGEGGLQQSPLSVHLSVQSCPVRFFIMQKIGSSYITKRLPMTRGCVIILTKLIQASPRSLGGKVQNSFPICIFFMEKNNQIFFLHTKIVMTRRCVIIQTIVIWASSMSLEGNVYIRVWSISFLLKIMRISYFTAKQLFMT